MFNIEKLQSLAKYRWAIVIILALLFSALSVSIFHLPFLMTALVLSIVGLIFAYHKSVWLVLFILSNLPMLATTLFAYQRHFTTLDTVIFFIIFLLTISSSYLIARKAELIPKISWKYFPPLKIIIGFALLFLVSLLTGIFAQIINQSPTTSNQDSLNELQKVIPIAVFATQTLAAGFLEELVYRVGIFEVIFKNQKYFAFLTALLLFAYMHGPTDLYSWLTYGLMSLVLTSLYAKYRNFYLNMSIHLLWNLFGLVIALMIK
ncbi:CPBP family intramembrane glutamic endopeptidase [Lactococcus lactis]|uniref:UPF0177 protein yvdC n=1 Tax=Lactococcus lactis subsp. lactis A12 TaxID=1137134 RepID=S6FUT9_LACLL|nr:type II CAAX endopeptidase family protein [Lactococcus lactis]MCT3131905.1 CPBP family intramembrane metalloprotease [Lactococcus lactis]MDT2851818.1 type II CAAX endopeptidase family protein [Lactococcus lactis]CDG05457.1 UPF0177 protein yvdC [Lactococcus lactis subsp. lactis A12]SBW31550.1 UPF0177 protein yvdC [Lactococcus lactis subsp. lactis]